MLLYHKINILKVRIFHIERTKHFITNHINEDTMGNMTIASSLRTILKDKESDYDSIISQNI